MKLIIVKFFTTNKKYIMPFVKYQAMLLFLILLTSVLSLVNPVLLKITIDNILVEKKGYMVKYVIVIFIIYFVLSTIASYLSGFYNTYITQKSSMMLRLDLFKHLQKVKINEISKIDIGDMICRIRDDVDIIISFLTSSLPTVLSSVLNLVATLVIMMIFSKKLTLIAVGIAIVQIILSLFYADKTKKLQRRIRINASNHMSFLKQSLVCLKVIKTHCFEKKNGINYFNILKDYNRLGFKKFFLSFNYTIVTSFIAFLGSTTIFIIAVNDVMNGSLTLGILFVFDSLNEKFYSLASSLVSLNINLQGALVSFERINELVNLEEESFKGENIIEASEIAFNNTSFKYNKEGKFLIENLSLSFNKGESYAVIGKSGEGKSTLASLLINFNEVDEGQITINNRAISDINLKSLRKQINLVIQDNFLIQGTIKENVKFGMKNVSQEEIEKACKICCIYDFIQTLPDKFETIISEDANKVSVGQKQRILLARNILRKSEVYIFDESLSNLDKSVEFEIFKNIQEEFKDSIQIFITHNIDLIKNIPNIIVISDGCVENFGPHEKLLQESITYKELYKWGK